MLASMSYPPEYRATATRSYHRPAKATSRQKLRPSQLQPFDPDELTRRLYTVIAEQKAHSERKKQARAEAERRARHYPSGADTDKYKDKDAAPLTVVKEKPPNLPTQQHKTDDKHKGEPQKVKLERTASKTSKGPGHNEGEDGNSSSYRHIPQVAASQFARTTTVESPTDRLLVHKLSKKAMKFHMEGPNANPEIRAVGPDASPFEQARALRRAQSMRERQYERNQCHHMPTLATTAEVDEKQAARLPHRHTFETYLKVEGMDPEEKKDVRRRSTGSILGRTESPPVGAFEMPAGLIPAVQRCESDEVIVDPSEHHRVDWTQSDEARVWPIPIATSPPPLRKPESRWTLRGRLGSFTKHGKDDKSPTPPDEKRASQESPKSPRAGFFARFKR
ncbi:hypothetical protein TOPH_00898 [Tolypocladium ophioglossoides CBS 100239]|uniref:Uncharacterized protein n=1 Tax=Tolypocladium ophioglossoides (strain CBS 100239) TaxID=1163406 RepID=A0A0L0NK42_TOLOC|nr:hypothetical protein TOPH_00898 [Tolypocladium ophioglossoides CBS 100239]